MRKIFPEYANEIALAPVDMDDAMLNQRFMVVRKTQEGRGMVVLVHRFGNAMENVVVAVHREYYVSNSYDVLQIVFICVPYQDGTLIVLGNDAFTDKVAGFASSMKHVVGRKMLTGAMENMLLDLQADVEQAEPFTRAVSP